MVHVVDLLDLGIALLHDVIERHHAHLLERRIERGKRLHRGVTANGLVVSQDGDAELVLHRYDRFREPAFLPSLCGALLALDRVSVHVIA